MQQSEFSTGCAWVAGNYVPYEKAAIPISDTGFTRSDVTYDVVAVWDGNFFRLDDHLARFNRAIELMQFSPPLSISAMRDTLIECVRRSGLRQAYVEMMVTRGSAPPGDRDPRNFKNQFYAFAVPYIWIVPEAEQATGIKLVIAQSTERISPRAVDPTVKNFHWGDLTKGLYEALARDAKTAVLLDDKGLVTEGPGFNIFIVKNGRLLTPKTWGADGHYASNHLRACGATGD